jgi:small ligand-binding sensory domain FIST
LAHLPGVYIETFHVTDDELPDLDSSPDAWVDLIGVQPSPTPHFLLFSASFSSGANNLLQGLDFAYPKSVTLGGQASGSGFDSKIALFCNDRLYRDGVLGVALSGNIILETIVAQGCRPIGQPLQVTKGDRNVIFELDQEVPLTVLRDLVASLSETEKVLAQNWLFVGVAMDEFKQELQPGDFLIRSILGVDPTAGAIAIGDRIRPGQRLQFHIRDAQTSADDLELLLQRYQNEHNLQQGAAAALMFSCLGRGTGLYGKPNFDSSLFQQYFQNIPLSGFFCGGEIGPVGGSTFLHAYTSVFGICRQA